MKIKILSGISFRRAEIQGDPEAGSIVTIKFSFVHNESTDKVPLKGISFKVKSTLSTDEFRFKDVYQLPNGTYICLSLYRDAGKYQHQLLKLDCFYSILQTYTLDKYNKTVEYNESMCAIDAHTVALIALALVNKVRCSCFGE